MRTTRVALATAIVAAAVVAVPTSASTTASDYGCTAGSGSQGPERHCGGYLAGEPDVTGQPTSLAWQVYLPDPAQWGPGPYPTVLDYSGYEPATTFFDGLKQAFISQGYAVAGVNVRGTGCSGGTFDYFEPKQWKDGADAIRFLTTQPWSDGHLAMVGKSYPGITQAFVASEQPRGLDAIVPGAFFADIYRDVAYPGGILNAAFASLWSLGSRPANEFDQWSSGVEKGDQTCIQSQAEHAANAPTNPFVELTEHPFDDANPWQQRSPDFFADKIKVPVMAELAWQDEELAARGIDLLHRLPSTTPWRAVVTNGSHGEYYDGWILQRIYRFLSFYVKKQVPVGDPCSTVTYVPHGGGHAQGHGSGVQPVTRAATYDEALGCYQSEPRIDDGFENGSQGPSWIQHFPTWPVTDRVQRLYLHSGGTLDTSKPTTPEPVTNYAYTPVLGTNAYRNLNDMPELSKDPTGTTDHEWWQDKPPAGTTASFTTAPLTQDEMLVGTGSLDLYLASTSPDTDVEVMVSELRKDASGSWQEEYVGKGWLRASHRKLDDSQSTPLRPYQTQQAADVQPLVPGQVTPLRVEIFPFGQVFRAGTRLRITIEAPNVQPELWGFAGLPTPSVNSISTDPQNPSSVALPLVPLPAGTTFPPERPCGYQTNQPCRPAT
jgi:predicted acyl esterase